jgi:O6-methylguanine-DNA--protein-cysteine methyltransferase
MGSQGQITGYAGGIWRKQALLKLENASFNSVVKDLKQ